MEFKRAAIHTLSGKDAGYLAEVGNSDPHPLNLSSYQHTTQNWLLQHTRMVVTATRAWPSISHLLWDVIPKGVFLDVPGPLTDSLSTSARAIQTRYLVKQSFKNVCPPAP